MMLCATRLAGDHVVVLLLLLLYRYTYYTDGDRQRRSAKIAETDVLFILITSPWRTSAA